MERQPGLPGRLVLALLLCAAGFIGSSQAGSSLQADSDRDGIPDYLDSCPGLANTAGSDRDGDRLSDACDLDPTGDGVIRPLPVRDQNSSSSISR
jgi:hypothetical protein